MSARTGTSGSSTSRYSSSRPSSASSRSSMGAISMSAFTCSPRCSAILPIGKMAEHLGEQVNALIEIAPILERELADEGLEELYRDVELPLVPVLADMEEAGVKIDVPYLQELSRELFDRVVELEARIYASV